MDYPLNAGIIPCQTRIIDQPGYEIYSTGPAILYNTNINES